MKYNDYKNNEKNFRSSAGTSFEPLGKLLPFEACNNEYCVHRNMNGQYREGRRSFERAVAMPADCPEKFSEIFKCDEDEQEENYGGKKQKYTLKNTVVNKPCCLILFVSGSVCEKMHNKKTADAMYSFPYINHKRFNEKMSFNINITLHNF